MVCFQALLTTCTLRREGTELGAGGGAGLGGWGGRWDGIRAFLLLPVGLVKRLRDEGAFISSLTE